jgi:hypothetical protein
LTGMPRNSFAIPAQRRNLRVDLNPPTGETELVRHVAIVKAQLSGGDALRCPFTGLSEPYEQAAFGCDARIPRRQQSTRLCIDWQQRANS